jgi:hypothetical protein
MTEKHQKVLEFFNSNGVELPIDVANAIEDVFNENENIENVDIYFREDIDALETDLIIVNEVDAYLGIPSTGSIQNTFTYYGEIDYSVSEFVALYKDNGEIIEDITNINNQESPTKINPDLYAVVLIENVEWSEGNITRTPKLYIYCPEEAGE